MDLAAHISAVRAGEGDPHAMLGEFRRTAVLCPVVEDGFLTGHYGGIRWYFTFTDEHTLARFLLDRGHQPSAEQEFAAVLGARLLDAFIPALSEPAGVAIDVAEPEGAMLLPPVLGIVPETAAVDAKLADAPGAPQPGGDR